MKALLLSLLLVACAAAPAPALRHPSSTAPLTVIATTDFHGALEAETVRSEQGHPLRIGGAALLGAYVKRLKQAVAGPVLWVDGGDLFQGTLASNLFEGAPAVRVFNLLGLQAAALGNHEFDYGPVGERSVPRAEGDDPQGALRARAKEASFPFLAANVRTTEGAIPAWLRPSIVVESQGWRIGVVGAASPDTPSTTNALNLRGLVFSPLLPAVQEEAERLRREEKVHAVVVVAHVGGFCENNDLAAQHDLSSCDEEKSEALALARDLPAGLVSVIVAGHTHRNMAKRVNGAVVLQPAAQGRYLGWAKVSASGELPVIEGLAPVCGETVGGTCDPFLVKKTRGPVEPAVFLGRRMMPDPAVTRLLAPTLDKVRAMQAEPLGVRVRDTFTRSYDRESALGNLMADLTREAVREADLGLVNGGGVRANLSPGALTYGHVFAVFPFDNQAALVSLTGAELTEVVKEGVARSGIARQTGFYSWSGNLRLEAEGCELKRLLIDGQPVDRKKTYRVVMADYLAGAGIGASRVQIPAERMEVRWDAGDRIRELVAAVLRRRGGELRAEDFYRESDPRQNFQRPCP